MSKLRATTFRIDSFERTSAGALRVKGYLTKTGVFTYSIGEDSVRELRADAEVFSPDSLDSLLGAPVTIDHPARFVDTENWTLLAVGNVISVKVDSPYVAGELQLHDRRAIELVEDGTLKEISLGYTTEVVALDGGEADFAQTNIVYNHAALGPEGWGRLGRDVALRLDSNQNLIFEDFMTEQKKTDAVEEPKPAEAAAESVEPEEQAAPEEPKQDSVEETSEEPTSEEPVQEQVTLDSLKTQLDEILARLPQQAEAEVETPADEERADSLDVDALVAEKVALTLKARDAFSRVFPEKRVDGHSIRELASAVVKHVDSEAAVESDTDEQLVEKAHLAAKATPSQEESDSYLRRALLGNVNEPAPSMADWKERIRSK